MVGFSKISKNINELDLNFSFETEPEDLDAYYIDIEIKQILNKRKVIIPHIFRKDGNAFNMKNFSLRINIPLIDIHGVSMPGKSNNLYLSKIPEQFEEEISSHRNFPFLSFINRKGINKIALGIKEPEPGYKITGKLDEESCELRLEVKTLGSVLNTSFQCEIFFSREEKSWFEITKAYSEWTETERKDIPSFAYEPVFCTWYAVHQNLHGDWIEKTALEARKLGYKTLIVDDGWFTSDSGRGYWYTGDWEVCDTFCRDFKKHVKRIQSIGMKHVLWIAPFMVGRYSRAYKKFKSLLVAHQESFANLCPQSELTYEHILEVITDLYSCYCLDGFKFDFIDCLPIKPCTEDNHKHFCATPGEGVKIILEEVKKRLYKLNSNIPLIEFRQRYATPIMRLYSTAFRASDTPFDFDTNRRRIINLRSFTGNFPVYSDPIFWHEGESLSNIALHFISCIFSVPMLSTDLLKLNINEKKIIRFWTNFFCENRDCLLFGKLIPIFAGGDFSGAYSFQNKRGILAFYNSNSLRLSDGFLNKELKELFILNGSNQEVVDLIEETLTGRWLIEIKNPDGRTIKDFETDLNRFLSMSVKIGGLIHLLRKQ